MIRSEAMGYASRSFVLGLIMPGVDNYAHAGGFRRRLPRRRMWLDPLKPERMDHFIVRRASARSPRARDPRVVVSFDLVLDRSRLRNRLDRRDSTIIAHAQTRRSHHRRRRRDRPRPDRAARRAERRARSSRSTSRGSTRPSRRRSSARSPARSSIAACSSASSPSFRSSSCFTSPRCSRRAPSSRRSRRTRSTSRAR